MFNTLLLSLAPIRGVPHALAGNEHGGGGHVIPICFQNSNNPRLSDEDYSCAHPNRFRLELPVYVDPAVYVNPLPVYVANAANSRCSAAGRGLDEQPATKAVVVNRVIERTDLHRRQENNHIGKRWTAR